MKDGTIKLELSCLRHMLNLARRYRDDLEKKDIHYEVAAVSFDMMSVQMHQAYVHLQASDIGKAFGTAKVMSIESKKARGGKK